MNVNNVDVQNKKYSTGAIVGMCLGVCSLFASVALGGFLFGIPGFITGIIALRDIKKNNLRGNGMVLVAIITSVIGFVLSLIFAIMVIYLVKTNTYVG